MLTGSDQKIPIAKLNQYLLDKNISSNYLDQCQPFDILFDNFVLNIEKLIRVIPNRRLVFYGKINNSEKIVLKIFINPSRFHKDYMKNEQGYNWLQRLELNTPKIISAYCDRAHKQSYFIYKYIEQEQNQFNKNYNLLISAIAKLHKNNICQSDLHVNNFIINNNTVYYLDYASLVKVKPFDDRINSCKQFDNFALFLAQLNIDEHVKWSDYIKIYLDYYLEDILKNKNKQELRDKIIIFILNKAKLYLKSRLVKFSDKCIRNSTEFKMVSHDDSENKYNLNGVFKRVAINERKTVDFIKDFLQNNDKIKLLVQNKKIQVLKNGNTAKVLLVEFNNKKFIIKHYLPGNCLQQIWRTVKYLFVKPRAIKSWLNANFLEHLGIATAKPLACLIKNRWGIMQDTFFIMEYLEDLTRLDVILESKQVLLDEKYRCIKKIKKLLDNFSFLNVVHKDFKSVNLGFKDQQLFLLDLDAMHQYNSNFLYRKLKDKDSTRITACLKDYPDLLNFYNAK